MRETHKVQSRADASEHAKWPMVRLREVATFGSGTTPSRANHDAYYLNGTVLWVKTGDLTNDDVRETDEQITQTALDECSCKVYPPGTVLIAMYGGFKQIGRTGLLRAPAAINQALTAVTVDRHRLDPSFLLNWLNFRIGEWRRFAGSSRKDPNITKGDIQQFFVPTPPINIQKEISATFRRWTEAIVSTQRLLKLKHRLKRGLMQQLLTGCRRFPEFAGKPWREVCIGDILREVNRTYKLAPQTSYRLVSIRRRSGGFFDREVRLGNQIGYPTLEQLHTGDFVIARRQVLHGAMATVPAEFHGAYVSNAYAILEAHDPNEVHVPFLNFVSQQPRLYYMAFRCSYGVAIEKMFFRLDWFLKERLRIPPTLAEQKKITAVLTTADCEIALLERQLAALREQKKGLMQKLLTGKVRVKVPEEKP